MFTRSKKFISMLIVFVMVFTYMGETLQAIATTDGIGAITNGFFSSGEMKFKSYFEDNKSDNISDVNEKATLIFEISPNDIGKGFLKEGIISALGLDENWLHNPVVKTEDITINIGQIASGQITPANIYQQVKTKLVETQDDI